MSTYIAIIIAAVLTNNFVLSKFYGCCPFLGVSKKLDSSADLSPDSGIYPGHCRICTAAGNGHQKADAAAV